MSQTATVTLLSKPGCHLCDAARDVVAGVVAQTPGVSFVETSILDDADAYDRYVEEIPVVFINGAVHNIWRVDAARLHAALLEATA